MRGDQWRGNSHESSERGLHRWISSSSRMPCPLRRVLPFIRVQREGQYRSTYAQRLSTRARREHPKGKMMHVGDMRRGHHAAQRTSAPHRRQDDLSPSLEPRDPIPTIVRLAQFRHHLINSTATPATPATSHPNPIAPKPKVTPPPRGKTTRKRRAEQFPLLRGHLFLRDAARACVWLIGRRCHVRPGPEADVPRVL